MCGVHDPGSPPLAITPLGPGDAPDVLRIFAEGIASGHATFETAVPT